MPFVVFLVLWITLNGVIDFEFLISGALGEKSPQFCCEKGHEETKGLGFYRSEWNQCWKTFQISCWWCSVTMVSMVRIHQAVGIAGKQMLVTPHKRGRVGQPNSPEAMAYHPGLSRNTSEVLPDGLKFQFQCIFNSKKKENEINPHYYWINENKHVTLSSPSFCSLSLSTHSHTHTWKFSKASLKLFLSQS